MRALLFFLLLTASASVYAQVPVIENIVPESTFPNDTIVISGRGFHEDSTMLEVWFESVKAQTIVQATEYSIVVVVPPQARFTNIEVLNKATNFSGKSQEKFMPSFPLGSFSAANFVSAYSLSQPDEFYDICTCDLNRDNRPDMAASKFKRTFGDPRDISVFLNTGSPGTASFNHFARTNLSVLNFGFPTDNIICGDLQGDGKPELMVTRAGGNRHEIIILQNTTADNASTPAFTRLNPLTMQTGHFSSRLVLRDLNNDGRPEIIASNNFNDIFYIFVNESTGSQIQFADEPITLSIKLQENESLTTYEAQVQDFDNDGLPDIVINQLQASDFYILRNTSAGAISFATAIKVPIVATLNRSVSADFNQDGKLDIIFTSTGSPSIPGDRVIMYINQSTPGNITFGAPIEIATSFEPWGIDAADIDGDQDPDFVVVNRNRATPVASETRINIFVNDGNATPTFTRSDITPISPTRNVKLTDMDGDSKADIVFTSFDAGTSTSRVNVLRNVNCFKPPILNTDLSICTGQTIRLQSIAVQNVTYTWKQGATTVGGNNPYHETSETGTYTVTATSGSCSETSSPVSVTKNLATAPPDPNFIGGDMPVCVGRTVDFSTDATADEYIWTGPNGYTSNVQNPPAIPVTTETAGFYTLRVREGVCFSEEVTKLIEVANLDDFEISTNASSSTLCQGRSIDLFVNDLDNFNFEWFKDGVTAGTGATLSIASLQQSNEGSYTVRITPPNTVDCPVVDTEPFALSVLTMPVAEFTSPAEECLGQPVTFTNTSTVDNQATVTYQWLFETGQTSTAQSPSYLYATAGSKTVRLDVAYTNITGCTDNVTHTVDIVTPVLPNIIASATSACPDEEVTLTINTFPTITWSTTATTPSITVNPGTYSVTTVDENGCDGTDEITIEEKEVPTMTASADPTEINAGRPSQLTASGAATYSWSPGETLSDSTISNPVATPLTTTTYTVTGTSVDGCTAEFEVLVVVGGPPKFPVAFSPNGDGQNELWDIQAFFDTDCMVTIFDGRGRKVFETKTENWDGTYQGKAAPEGTYYYVFSCPDDKPVTGSVLLFR